MERLHTTLKLGRVWGEGKDGSKVDGLIRCLMMLIVLAEPSMRPYNGGFEMNTKKTRQKQNKAPALGSPCTIRAVARSEKPSLVGVKTAIYSIDRVLLDVTMHLGLLVPFGRGLPMSGANPASGRHLG